MNIHVNEKEKKKEPAVGLLLLLLLLLLLFVSWHGRMMDGWMDGWAVDGDGCLATSREASQSS